MKRILFVCLGNICRSPAAEAVFAAKASAAGLAVSVDSAGTGGWHIGDPPYPPMIAAAAARGYDLAPLRARQVRRTDFDDFDLILAMDRVNLADLSALRPGGNATPLHLMLDNAPACGTDEVPDPYYTRDFDQALDLIELAADGLVTSLARSA
ncbi:low molecular weight protein-tyrosine-phosphatase [Defluviimonas aestuarii]|uniref:low molecular weight protein-tyrosine-phosphatase n=1 Tax=Albidovulum aestuarii TaxID=1130726 RepID=UPI00249C9A60|nr:low molecular weight protein-tyrosine-phosphatase [Defluviimonas aestuarii]MDI3335982.1 low molecular weight protein-tyrosine-phosphatase [Defluviimonas aestuarii]